RALGSNRDSFIRGIRHSLSRPAAKGELLRRREEQAPEVSDQQLDASGADDCRHLQATLAGGRVQARVHQPVGESPTEAKRLKPRSWGGAVERKQDGEALRQHAQKGACATHQVATYSERRRSLVTRESGGRDGPQRAKAARADRNGSDAAALSGGVSAATWGEGGCANWR